MGGRVQWLKLWVGLIGSVEAVPGEELAGHQVLKSMETAALATAKSSIVLNEIFVRNESLPTLNGRLCGWVELWNPSDEEVNLSEMSLSDRSDQPRRWVFPEGSQISARGFVRICFEPGQPESGANAPFELPPHGGAVYLFNAPAQGGAVLDTLTFGVPAADFAVGRVPDGGNVWRLTEPTELNTNKAAQLGKTSSLRLNEWMADVEGGPDWFELFNSSSDPVSLGGLFLTNDLRHRTKSPIQPLSFIGVGKYAFVQFLADRKVGANHANFQIANAGSTLAIFSGAGDQIDVVTFGSQLKGVSQGRIPDGSAAWARFPETSTPGAANAAFAPEPDADEDGLPDAWELLHGLNVEIDDAAGDRDGDGWSNRDEYLAGTDPQNAASGLRLAVQSEGGTSASLSFEGVAGRSYTVQISTSFEPLQWARWIDLPARTNSGPVFVLDPAPAPGTRFYRVVTPVMP